MAKVPSRIVTIVVFLESIGKSITNKAEESVIKIPSIHEGFSSPYYMNFLYIFLQSYILKYNMKAFPCVAVGESVS